MTTGVAAIFGALALMPWEPASAPNFAVRWGSRLSAALPSPGADPLHDAQVIYLFFERLGEHLGMGSSHAAAGDGNAVTNRVSEPFIRRPVATVLLTSASFSADF